MTRERSTGLPLEDLEICLETPVVSGELTVWGSRLAECVDEGRTEVHYLLAKAHPDEFAEIAEQDPDQLARVQQLRNDGDRLLKEYDLFAQNVRDFAAATLEAEPDETRLAPWQTKIVEVGLALVLAIRKQEVVVRTWYDEAFTRERGVGD